jgi:hypothetical protein
MGNRTLSNPAIRINDDLVEIVPNSLSYTGGEGEVNVRAASAGSGVSISVHSENAETQISMVKFSVYPKDDLDAKIRTWKDNIGINVIKMTEGGGRVVPVIRVFKAMSLTNDVERNVSADGVVELEFKGDVVTL